MVKQKEWLIYISQLPFLFLLFNHNFLISYHISVLYDHFLFVNNNYQTYQILSNLWTDIACPFFHVWHQVYLYMYSDNHTVQFSGLYCNTGKLIRHQEWSNIILFCTWYILDHNSPSVNCGILQAVSMTTYHQSTPFKTDCMPHTSLMCSQNNNQEEIIIIWALEQRSWTKYTNENPFSITGNNLSKLVLFIYLFIHLNCY